MVCVLSRQPAAAGDGAAAFPTLAVPHAPAVATTASPPAAVAPLQAQRGLQVDVGKREADEGATGSSSSEGSSADDSSSSSNDGSGDESNDSDGISHSIELGHDGTGSCDSDATSHHADAATDDSDVTRSTRGSSSDDPGGSGNDTGSGGDDGEGDGNSQTAAVSAGQRSPSSRQRRTRRRSSRRRRKRRVTAHDIAMQRPLQPRGDVGLVPGIYLRHAHKPARRESHPAAPVTGKAALGEPNAWMAQLIAPKTSPGAAALAKSRSRAERRRRRRAQHEAKRAARRQEAQRRWAEEQQQRVVSGQPPDSLDLHETMPADPERAVRTPHGLEGGVVIVRSQALISEAGHSTAARSAAEEAAMSRVAHVGTTASVDSLSAWSVSRPNSAPATRRRRRRTLAAVSGPASRPRRRSRSRRRRSMGVRRSRRRRSKRASRSRSRSWSASGGPSVRSPPGSPTLQASGSLSSVAPWMQDRQARARRSLHERQKQRVRAGTKRGLRRRHTVGKSEFGHVRPSDSLEPPPFSPLASRRRPRSAHTGALLPKLDHQGAYGNAPAPVRGVLSGGSISVDRDGAQPSPEGLSPSPPVPSQHMNSSLGPPGSHLAEESTWSQLPPMFHYPPAARVGTSPSPVDSRSLHGASQFSVDTPGPPTLSGALSWLSPPSLMLDSIATDAGPVTEPWLESMQRSIGTSMPGDVEGDVDTHDGSKLLTPRRFRPRVLDPVQAARMQFAQTVFHHHGFNVGRHHPKPVPATPAPRHASKRSGTKRGRRRRTSRRRRSRSNAARRRRSAASTGVLPRRRSTAKVRLRRLRARKRSAPVHLGSVTQSLAQDSGYAPDVSRLTTAGLPDASVSTAPHVHDAPAALHHSVGQGSAVTNDANSATTLQAGSAVDAATTEPGLTSPAPLPQPRRKPRRRARSKKRPRSRSLRRRKLGQPVPGAATRRPKPLPQRQGVLPRPRNHVLAMMLDKGLMPKSVAKLYGPLLRASSSAPDVLKPAKRKSVTHAPGKPRPSTTARAKHKRGRRGTKGPTHASSPSEWHVKGWATGDRATALSFLSTNGLSMASVKARDRRSVTACARFQALWRGFRVRVAFQFMRYDLWLRVGCDAVPHCSVRHPA